MPEGVHMPRYQEEERIYHKGFRDGWTAALESQYYGATHEELSRVESLEQIPRRKPRPKRKLSAWNKFVKTNSKKKIYRYANGKVNLKKLGVAYRKTKRGKR